MTRIKAFEQCFYLNLHYFSRNSLVACGVSANATSVFESCFAGEYVPKPSAQILAIWLFADRVTVFNTVFELLICCGSTPVMKRLHRKCNFNRQLQYLPNEFVITCWGKSFSGSNLMQLSTKTIDVKKEKSNL